MAADPEFIIVGRVSGLFGVRGWVKVYSYTEPRENIVTYSPWYLRTEGGEWSTREVVAGHRHGKGIVAQLRGCDDRDAAAALLGAEVAIRREQLPETAPGEFYWSDLVGLEVVTREGMLLGRVDHLLETGANDVLVVMGERERLIPYIDGSVILGVDLEGGRIEVDWDPEF